jgi:3-oxoacyl-[acyl-carrier protein] reductase
MTENGERVALITGGSKGIGRAIIAGLLEPGMKIAFNHFDPPEDSSADETVALVEAQGNEVICERLDVSDYGAVQGFVDAIMDRWGRIDILVNNAGITRDTLFMRMKEADWDAVIQVNLRSVFACTHTVMRPMMKQRYGRIVNMASVVGLMGNVSQANYAASKAGIIGFTKSVARELAGRNITVNAVAPGFIKTAMTDVLSEAVKEAFMKQIPLGRPGTVEDVAKAVKWLVSDDAAYITGQVLHVNGGMLMP